MRGLYVHVPFCLGKCSYCDFYSVRHETFLEEVYLQAMQREIAIKGQLWGGGVSTLYFGGGTPSTLSLQSIEAIISSCDRYFPRQDGSELTLEINPGTAWNSDFARLRDIGINRISVGLQSSSPAQLALLGRPHDLPDFYRTIERVLALGINNFSVDALYGLPGQTVSDYLETLACIGQTGAVHVSAYALQIEPQTPFAELYSRGNLNLPADDEVADMMLVGRDYLIEQGFKHYEISNFARPGFESRHNLLYWRNLEYIGFGPSAASYVHRRRFSSVPDIKGYSKLLGAGSLPTASCEKLDQAGEIAETIILGLRMLEEGVNRLAFRRRFGVDLLSLYDSEVKKLESQGLLCVSDETIRLTVKGFPLANQVQMAFLP